MILPERIILSIKILSAIVLTFITLNLVSCSDDPSSIGSAFLSRDFIKLDSLDSFKDTFPQFSYTYKNIIPLGFSSTLLLGKKGDDVATMLLSFNIIVPDSVKTDLINNAVVVSSATVQLYKNYNFGDSTASIDYTVHSVNNAWTSTSFTVDSLPNLQYDAADVSSNKSFTDTLYQFNLSNDLALKWLNIYANSQTPDNGVAVIPSQNSGKIVGFYALTSATNINIPFLVVVLNKTGGYQNDTLKFSTTADLSVITGNQPQNQTENIFVQSSIELESRIQFNLSKVPEHAIINYAELQLTIDTTQSVFGSAYSDQLTAYYITDSTRIDSFSTNQVTLNRIGSLYTGNITTYVQNWVSTKINEGIQVRAGAYDTGLELWALKGSKAADPSKRPRLKIIYTNKK
jgi:TGF-beta propeptide